ncbi:MAG: hypothetical protein WD604_14960 [Balneolaceae bacterium]
MGAWCDAMKETSTEFFRWIFPEKIEIPDCLRTLYETLYPDINWDSVNFYLGKPWFAKSNNIRGITLPDNYGVHEIKIYFSQAAGVYDPCSCAGLETPVHEGYHVQQYREILDGAGVGFFRGFMIAYLAGSWRGGGSGHSMETAAHNYHTRFGNCCTISPCDCSVTPPATDNSAISNLLACDPNLVVTDTGVSFWELMLDATPGARWIWEKGKELGEWACHFDRNSVEIEDDFGRMPALLSDRSWSAIGKWMLICSSYGTLSLLIRLLAVIWVFIWGVIWTVITIIITILLPIIDLVLLIIDGILWIATGIVCALEWLWEKIRAGLVAACDWSESLEQKCTEWREDRERKCVEEEDQGYSECAQEEDQGYNECSEEEDQGYRDCCDWWPCSWACDAWTWVSKIVCVAWTWVSKIVCVAWTWVSKIVCVAWTWIVTRSCAAFTWVVKGLTCWAK